MTASHATTTLIRDLLGAPINVLWATVISALISVLISYLLRRQERRYSAEIEYEYEQRKKLREVIGRHHGRLLNAATSFNYRMWNLYSNESQGWLNVSGSYSTEENYYFQSTVYRFLSVVAVVRMVEDESLLLDARIAIKKDFTFLSYASIFHWSLTDVSLFTGVDYDINLQKDHFFSDQLRRYGNYCIQDGRLLSSEDFTAKLGQSRAILPVFQFFDGLRRDEYRLRWDRLTVFHLLLMAFINSFGYKRQYAEQQKFNQAAAQIRHHRILDNLVEWIHKHSLEDDHGARMVIRAAKALAHPSGNGPGN